MQLRRDDRAEVNEHCSGARAPACGLADSVQQRRAGGCRASSPRRGLLWRRGSARELSKEDRITPVSFSLHFILLCVLCLWSNPKQSRGLVRCEAARPDTAPCSVSPLCLSSVPSAALCGARWEVFLPPEAPLRV